VSGYIYRRWFEGRADALTRAKERLVKGVQYREAGFYAVAEVGTVAHSSPTSVAATPPPLAVVDAAGRLLPWATRRINDLMAKRGIRQSDVLDELGFKKLNPSLSLALERGNRIHDARLASALEKWISDHAHL